MAKGTHLILYSQQNVEVLSGDVADQIGPEEASADDRQDDHRNQTILDHFANHRTTPYVSDLSTGICQFPGRARRRVLLPLSRENSVDFPKKPPPPSVC